MQKINFLFFSITIAGIVFFTGGIQSRAEENAAGDIVRTVITSDTLKFDYRRSIALFTGNVIVKDPALQLTSRQLVVMFDSTNQVKSLTAVGNVVLMSEDREGRCDKLVYLTSTGEIVMTGNAAIRRAGDEVSGNLIKIWRNDQRMEVEPGRLVIQGGTMPGELVPVPRPGGGGGGR